MVSIHSRIIICIKTYILFFQGPVQLNIAVPMMTEKAEWKLNGQTLNITLQLSDTVATMKALIHEQTGMPPGKQKLQYEVLYERFKLYMIIYIYKKYF